MFFDVLDGDFGGVSVNLGVGDGKDIIDVRCDACPEMAGILTDPDRSLRGSHHN